MPRTFQLLRTLAVTLTFGVLAPTTAALAQAATSPAARPSSVLPTGGGKPYSTRPTLRSSC